MNNKKIVIAGIIIVCINILITILFKLLFFLNIYFPGTFYQSLSLINSYLIPAILLAIFIILYFNTNIISHEGSANKNINEITLDNIESKNEKKFFKKIAMIVLISLLALSALAGIIIFLIGDFNDFKGKILLTALTIDFYSITGLCSIILFNKKINLLTLISSIIGIVIAITGFAFTVLFIWEVFNSSDYWKILFFFIAFSFSLSHVNLFLVISTKNIYVRISQIITVFFIIIVFFMFLYLVNNEFHSIDDSFWKLFGICGILDVLGTIATPVLKKILK